jgi:hypothetical protein
MRIFLRSSETFVGMHRVTGKPSAAPSMAKAIPVLPLVASSKVFPGENWPDRRPSRIMLAAARSFTAGHVFRETINAQQRSITNALNGTLPEARVGESRFG